MSADNYRRAGALAALMFVMAAHSYNAGQIAGAAIGWLVGGLIYCAPEIVTTIRARMGG